MSLVGLVTLVWGMLRIVRSLDAAFFDTSSLPAINDTASIELQWAEAGPATGSGD